MSLDHDNTVDQLNQLIHVNRNCEEQLRGAAQQVQNSELETLFGGYAKQHDKFANELIEEVHRLRGDTSHPESSGGTLHRKWMDLKAAVTGHSPGALLQACENTEESAEMAYRDVADENPSGQTHSLIEKHHSQIKAFRTRLARLVGEVKDGVEFQINE